MAKRSKVSEKIRGEIRALADQGFTTDEISEQYPKVPRKSIGGYVAHATRTKDANPMNLKTIEWTEENLPNIRQELTNLLEADPSLTVDDILVRCHKSAKPYVIRGVKSKVTRQLNQRGAETAPANNVNPTPIHPPSNREKRTLENLGLANIPFEGEDNIQLTRNRLRELLWDNPDLTRAEVKEYLHPSIQDRTGIFRKAKADCNRWKRSGLTSIPTESCGLIKADGKSNQEKNEVEQPQPDFTPEPTPEPTLAVAEVDCSQVRLFAEQGYNAPYIEELVPTACRGEIGFEVIRAGKNFTNGDGYPNAKGEQVLIALVNQIIDKSTSAEETRNRVLQICSPKLGASEKLIHDILFLLGTVKKGDPVSKIREHALYPFHEDTLISLSDLAS